MLHDLFDLGQSNDFVESEDDLKLRWKIGFFLSYLSVVVVSDRISFSVWDSQTLAHIQGKGITLFGLPSGNAVLIWWTLEPRSFHQSVNNIRLSYIHNILIIHSMYYRRSSNSTYSQTVQYKYNVVNFLVQKCSILMKNYSAIPCKSIVFGSHTHIDSAGLDSM